MDEDPLDKFRQTPPRRPVHRYLSRAEVAEYIGLKSVKSLSRVRLPDPDAQIGNHKGWLPSTIDEWNKSRPGRGWWGARTSPRRGNKSDGD